MTQMFKHNFQRESDMDEDGAQREPVLPRFTRSTKKREQGTLQKWVQCTRCKKWRRVPFQLKDGDLGENWECKDNAWDSQFSSCKVPQALSDEQIDAILDACQESEDDPDEDGNEERGHHTDGLPMSFQASLPEGLEDMTAILPKDVEDVASAFPGTFTRRIRTSGASPASVPRKSSRLGARGTNAMADEPSSTAVKHVSGPRVKEIAKSLSARGRSGVTKGSRERKPGKSSKSVRNGTHELNEPVDTLMGANGSYVYSQVGDSDLRLGSTGGESSRAQKISKFSPGKIVWGKVDGHDWWPALVVRRRSVPSEVGPPPGGVSEVMTYTPVVFFTPKGIPKEVELGMDSVEYPIAMCRRACGEIDEDEAEYAWLSQDKIRVFLRGQHTGRQDGTVGTDHVLKESVEAAHRALSKSNHPSSVWGTDEADSDGGWACAAGLVGSTGGKSRSHKKKQSKSRGHSKKKLKVDEDGSDGDSGEGGQEWLSYGSWLPQPKIVVEHIHAWRHPQTLQEHEKERELERRSTTRRLRQLVALQRAIDHGLHPAECLTSVLNVPHDTEDIGEVPQRLSTLEGSHGAVPEALAGENLRQEEREAVSTLLGFSENPSQFNGPPFTSTAQDLHGWGEPEYFVKYANRSHMYNEWVNESTLCKIAKRKLINFKRRYGDSPVNMFVEEWAEPERLVARRKCRVGPGWELLVKWKELGYEHCTWEVENCRMLAKPEAVTLYLALWDRQRKAFYRSSPRAQNLAQEIKRMVSENMTPIEGQPSWVRGSRLLTHQINSLNWFRSKWLAKKPGLLIGNAGLGKTACVISFIQALREELRTIGPVLIVVPNGQLERWCGEVEFWSGSKVDCVIYQGPSAARSIIWEYEIWQVAECADGNVPCHESKKIPRAEVVLASYENMTSDFSEVPWSLTILDCRGGSKGSIARMVSMLSGVEAMHLMVATHLPDTPGGLSSMLKFMNSQPENEVDDSISNDSGSEEENLVANLKQSLGQHIFQMARPTQERSMSRFREFLVPFQFTPQQEDQFRRTLAKHYEVLTDQSIPRHSGQNVSSFRRIVQDLCQVCHHPLLLEDDLDEFENASCEALLEASGKLQTLSKILDCVRMKNAKAMILTQTTKMSDLLSHFLSLRFGPNSFERAIPSDSALIQHQAVQSFSSPGSPSSFVFLTTPETCGLGTCLPAVNLVVVYDSSPDPANDLLATGRARKIGRTYELPVIRLFAEKSVEERVLALADVRENGLEALLGTVHTRGTAADSKLLEDILISGSQLVFQKHKSSLMLENQDNTNVNTKIAKSQDSVASESVGYKNPDETKSRSKGLMSLVNSVLGIELNGQQKVGEKSGSFDSTNGKVLWRVRGINPGNAAVDPGTPLLDEESTCESPGDGRSFSSFWESLVKEIYDRMRREERLRQDGLRIEERLRQEKLRTVLEVSDHEDESGDPLEQDGTLAQNTDDVRKTRANSVKPPARRKRSQDFTDVDLDVDVDEAAATRKRRKSGRPAMEAAPHVHRDWFHRRNGHGQWSRDSLLSSKTQQDVLMRVISDPSTLEGQAAQRAFNRIDQIASDLNLPLNIVLMARQIAEVLLTMREETDQGAYFQDYTLVVLVAFAAHLGNLDLGDKYGLLALSQKYGQDVASMEQVFQHITRMMQEYKETMLKIKGLDSNWKGAGPTATAKKENGVPSPPKTVVKKEPSAALGPRNSGDDKEGGFLHKELDGFLKRLSEVLETDHRPHVEIPPEILSEPPGAPIKGQTPSYQWFLANSSPSTPELAELFRQARACDVEIYIIEKAHALKTKAIEKVVLDFQEKVREYGLKALEEAKGHTLRLNQQVAARQSAIQGSLANYLSLQATQTPGQISGQQSAYLQLLRALQASGGQSNLASLPMGSASLTPSFHAVPIPFPRNPSSMEPALSPNSTSVPASSIAMRGSMAMTLPASLPHVLTPPGQQALETSHLIQKAMSTGTSPPLILHATAGVSHQANQQQWRPCVPPSGAGAPSHAQGPKALGLLLAQLNTPDRSHHSRYYQYAVPQSSGHTSRLHSVSNHQILMQHLQQPQPPQQAQQAVQPQQSHAQQRLIPESTQSALKHMILPYSQRQTSAANLTSNNIPSSSSLPAVSVEAPSSSGPTRPAGSPGPQPTSSSQIPASFGAALSSLMPQYGNSRVVSHNSASVPSGSLTLNEIAAGCTTGRTGQQHHTQTVQTPQLSFVHGTARVIPEKPPTIHIEPAQAARVVLSHGVAGVSRPASAGHMELPQSSSVEVVTRGNPSVSGPIVSPIITGDNPARPQSPGLQTAGSVGATITTGSGGVVHLHSRAGNGLPQHGAQVAAAGCPVSKPSSVVTTGTEPGVDLAPSGSVSSHPRTLPALLTAVPAMAQMPSLVQSPSTSYPLRVDSLQGGISSMNQSIQASVSIGQRSDKHAVGSEPVPTAPILASEIIPGVSELSQGSAQQDDRRLKVVSSSGRGVDNAQGGVEKISSVQCEKPGGITQQQSAISEKGVSEYHAKATQIDDILTSLGEKYRG